MTVVIPHNWANAVVVDTEWQTSVVRSVDDEVEERRGLVSRPRRTVQVRWTGLTREEATQLQFYLMRIGDERVYVPLYCDDSITTATSSGTAIYCDTTLRRFHAGAEVVIYTPTTDGPTNVQRRTIDSITATQINLTSALTGSYSAGAIVAPALLCEIVLEAELAAFTDNIADVAATFREVLESSLPGYAAYADLAAEGYDTLGGYYIFDTPVDWRQPITVRSRRTGGAEVVGRSSRVATQGPRPFLSYELPLGVLSRDQFARLLKFFDGHAGRLVPWILVSPLTLWSATAISTTYVDVEAFGDIADAQDFGDYIAIVTAAETFVRPVSSVAVQGSGWRITFGSAISAIALADIQRTTLAHFARFAADAITEEWLTSEVVNVKASAVTVPADEAVEVMVTTNTDCVS